MSLSSGDEVPHIFTRKSRLQPGEFLISSAKGLLQHNPDESGHCSAPLTCPPSAMSGHDGHGDREKVVHTLSSKL